MENETGADVLVWQRPDSAVMNDASRGKAVVEALAPLIEAHGDEEMVLATSASINVNGAGLRFSTVA